MCPFHLGYGQSRIASALGGLTQASFIVQIRVSEVEISMELSIIELHSHSVMSVLVDCPHEPCEVEALRG